MDANHLRVIRTLHDLSQWQLAEILGYSQSYIAHVERGSKPLNDVLRNKVMEALDLSQDQVAQIIELQAEYGA